MVVKKPEIRVHISAPGRCSDDERTRQRTHAYLNADFQPTTTSATRSDHSQDVHVLQTIGKTSHANYGNASICTGKLPNNNINQVTDRMPIFVTTSPETCHRLLTTSFLGETQPAVSALESQLISSSLRLSGESLKPPKRLCEPPDDFENVRVRDHMEDITEDTRLIKRVRRSDLDFETCNNKAESVHAARLNLGLTDSSSTQEKTPSSYLKSPELEKSGTKGGVHKQYPQRRPISNSLLQHLSRGDKEEAPAIKGNCAPSQAHQPNEDTESCSEMPTTYDLSDITSGSSRTKAPSIQRSASDPGPMPASEATHMNDNGLSNAFHPSTEIPTPCAQNETRESISVQGTIERDLQTQALVRKLQNLPRLISPPIPETSLAPFRTSITELLRFLAEDSVVSTRYTPVATAREVEKLERGYWLVNTSSWKPELQLSFWGFLTKHITGGDLGWGIRLARQGDDEVNGGDLIEDAEGLGYIKVFCWGEIVKHTYLLLYVASSGKVSRAGARWKDAKQKVVVQMRGSV